MGCQAIKAQQGAAPAKLSPYKRPVPLKQILAQGDVDQVAQENVQEAGQAIVQKKKTKSKTTKKVPQFIQWPHRDQIKFKQEAAAKAEKELPSGQAAVLPLQSQQVFKLIKQGNLTALQAHIKQNKLEFSSLINLSDPSASGSTQQKTTSYITVNPDQGIFKKFGFVIGGQNPLITAIAYKQPNIVQFILNNMTMSLKQFGIGDIQYQENTLVIDQIKEDQEFFCLRLVASNKDLNNLKQLWGSYFTGLWDEHDLLRLVNLCVNEKWLEGLEFVLQCYTTEVIIESLSTQKQIEFVKYLLEADNKIIFKSLNKVEQASLAFALIFILVSLDLISHSEKPQPTKLLEKCISWLSLVHYVTFRYTSPELFESLKTRIDQFQEKINQLGSKKDKDLAFKLVTKMAEFDKKLEQTEAFISHEHMQATLLSGDADEDYLLRETILTDLSKQYIDVRKLSPIEFTDNTDYLLPLPLAMLLTQECAEQRKVSMLRKLIFDQGVHIKKALHPIKKQITQQDLLVEDDQEELKEQLAEDQQEILDQQEQSQPQRALDYVDINALALTFAVSKYADGTAELLEFLLGIDFLDIWTQEQILILWQHIDTDDNSKLGIDKRNATIRYVRILLNSVVVKNCFSATNFVQQDYFYTEISRYMTNNNMNQERQELLLQQPYNLFLFLDLISNLDKQEDEQLMNECLKQVTGVHLDSACQMIQGDQAQIIIEQFAQNYEAWVKQAEEIGESVELEVVGKRIVDNYSDSIYLSEAMGFPVSVPIIVEKKKKVARTSVMTQVTSEEIEYAQQQAQGEEIQVEGQNIGDEAVQQFSLQQQKSETQLQIEQEELAILPVIQVAKAATRFKKLKQTKQKFKDPAQELRSLWDAFQHCDSEEVIDILKGMSVQKLLDIKGNYELIWRVDSLTESVLDIGVFVPTQVAKAEIFEINQSELNVIQLAITMAKCESCGLNQYQQAQQSVNVLKYILEEHSNFEHTGKKLLIKGTDPRILLLNDNFRGLRMSILDDPSTLVFSYIWDRFGYLFNYDGINHISQYWFNMCHGLKAGISKDENVHASSVEKFLNSKTTERIYQSINSDTRKVFQGIFRGPGHDLFKPKFEQEAYQIDEQCDLSSQREIFNLIESDKQQELQEKIEADQLQQIAYFRLPGTDSDPLGRDWAIELSDGKIVNSSELNPLTFALSRDKLECAKYLIEKYGIRLNQQQSILYPLPIQVRNNNEGTNLQFYDILLAVLLIARNDKILQLCLKQPDITLLQGSQINSLHEIESLIIGAVEMDESPWVTGLKTIMWSQTGAFYFQSLSYHRQKQLISYHIGQQMIKTPQYFISENFFKTLELKPYIKHLFMLLIQKKELIIDVMCIDKPDLRVDLARKCLVNLSHDDFEILYRYEHRDLDELIGTAGVEDYQFEDPIDKEIYRVLQRYNNEFVIPLQQSIVQTADLQEQEMQKQVQYEPEQQKLLVQEAQEQQPEQELLRVPQNITPSAPEQEEARQIQSPPHLIRQNNGQGQQSKMNGQQIE